MKLDEVYDEENRGQSKHGNRLLTQVDMAFLKRDEAIRNSMVKRGEYKRSNHTDIVKCGCGATGCAFEVDMTINYKGD